MRISEASEGGFERGDDGRFAGEVWLRSTLAADDGTNIGVVHFSPGSRTHWHQHPGGQFLYGVAGRGRVRSRGEAGRILEPGDVIHVGPGEWHFHGGTRDTPMVHVAVNGGGAPEWGEPVSDDDYDEGFA
ncbi:MAG: cupin domain-containing protein [Actinomycetota bacterium]